MRRAAAVAVLAAVDLPAGDRSAEEIGAAVAAVLSEERFADRVPGLLERAMALAADWLSRLLAVLSGTPVGRVGTAIAFAAAAAALVAGGIWLARRMGRGPRGAASPPVSVGGRTPQEWNAAADAAARDGDLREAIRCRHRALVAAFVADGLLEEVPGRTAGRYLAAVAADVPAAAEPFARATAGFEDAWYGHRPVTPDDADAVDRAVREALAARFSSVSASAVPA